MSILAEPRRKQRLSIDPRNLQWKKDQDKFSQKLMKKMGWSQGEGLGRNLQGSADHIKLKANYTGKGLGADKLASYDSTWIGHHDDFADLLSALNKNKKEKATTEEEKEERAKRISLELSSKSLRRRIHYQKFTRAKDTSNYTESDRAAILGIVHKPETGSPQKDKTKQESPIKKEEEVELKPNTTVSSMSVGEYFAAKMAAMKAKREQSEEKTDNVKLEERHIKEEITEQETEEEEKEKKNMRKEERRLGDSMHRESPSESCQVKVENMEEEEAIESEEERRRRRKKEKKLKRRRERERAEMEGEVKRVKVEVCEEDEIEVKRKDKKSKDKLEMAKEAETLAGETSESRKKKKKNKSKKVRQ